MRVRGTRLNITHAISPLPSITALADYLFDERLLISHRRTPSGMDTLVALTLQRGQAAAISTYTLTKTRRSGLANPLSAAHFHTSGARARTPMLHRARDRE